MTTTQEQTAGISVLPSWTGDPTPLHYAAAAADEPALLQLLVGDEADPNARCRGGFTPLHAAAAAYRSAALRHQTSRMERIELTIVRLLAAGADPTLRDELNRLPAAHCEGLTPRALREAMATLAGQGAFPADHAGRVKTDGVHLCDRDYHRRAAARKREQQEGQ